MTKVLECVVCKGPIYGLDPAEICDARWDMIHAYEVNPTPCEQHILEDKFVCKDCLRQDYEQNNVPYPVI